MMSLNNLNENYLMVDNFKFGRYSRQLQIYGSEHLKQQ